MICDCGTILTEHWSKCGICGKEKEKKLKKVSISTGCLSFDIEVDGKSFWDFNKKEEEEFLDYLLGKFKQEYYQHTVDIQQLIELFQYVNTEDLGYCDQCHDNSYVEHYEI